MPGDIYDIEVLIHKSIKGELSPEEMSFLENWLKDEKNRQSYPFKLEEREYLLKELSRLFKIDVAEGMRLAEQKIFAPKTQLAQNSRIGWMRYIAAAAIILIVSTSSYFWFTAGNRVKVATTRPAVNNKVNDVAPGQHKAVLLLANGQKIVLNKTTSGLLASEGNTNITGNDGQLRYNVTTGPAPEMLYNTLVTEKGQMYPVVLSDGSKIYLNALSSIRYPVSFSGNERVVEITGEAYFEVAHDPGKPFKVRFNNGSEVEVLGTVFDINTYSDEPAIKTTLLKGKIKITASGKSVILKPGDQAMLAPGSGIDVKEHSNTTQAVAWVNGYFNFDMAGTKTVMRQLSRWYNIEIVYEGNITEKYFIGEIERDLSLLQVLPGLEKSLQLHFKVQGDKLFVSQ